MTNLNTLKALAVAMLPWLFAGCASSQLSGDPARQQNADEAAVLLGSRYSSTSEAVGLASGDQRNINVDAVFPPIWEKLTVLPGERRITVFIGGQKLRVAETVDLGVEARHTYRFTAKRDGLAFLVRVWDETAGAENGTLVREFRVAGDTPSLAGTESGRYVRP